MLGWKSIYIKPLRISQVILFCFHFFFLWSKHFINKCEDDFGWQTKEQQKPLMTQAYFGEEYNQDLGNVREQGHQGKAEEFNLSTVENPWQRVNTAIIPEIYGGQIKQTKAEKLHIILCKSID